MVLLANIQGPWALDIIGLVFGCCCTGPAVPNLLIANDGPKPKAVNVKRRQHGLPLLAWAPCHSCPCTNLPIPSAAQTFCWKGSVTVLAGTRNMQHTLLGQLAQKQHSTYLRKHGAWYSKVALKRPLSCSILNPVGAEGRTAARDVHSVGRSLFICLLCRVPEGCLHM